MIHSLPLQTRQTLKALGFSDNECKVLLPLFAKRKLSAKAISQQTALSFDTVHYTLYSLQKKKLIHRTSRNKEDMVEICTDAAFIQWIDEQKTVNASVYDEAKETLDTFLTTIKEADWKPTVNYFEGKQGVIDIYEDMIREGKDIYGWRDIRKLHESLGGYVDTYIGKRVQKGIHSYGIMPRNSVNTAYAKKKEQGRKVKFSDHLDIDGEIRIYGNKVAIITFHEDNPVGLVISGPVTQLFKAIFDEAWKGT